MKKLKQITTGQAARLLLAGYILVMLLLQLFTFEAFPGMLSVAGIVAPWSYVLAVLLVVLELLALPFLIDLRLPSGAVLASKVSGLLAIGLATVLEIFGLANGQAVMFGATFDLPSGSWTLFLLAALWVLMVWGLMPRSSFVSRKTQARP